ncbi:hypothetical protein AB5I39_02335 [Sphingomonas sp. MMS24-J45]
MSKSDPRCGAKKTWVKPVVEKADAAVATQANFNGGTNDGIQFCSS